MKAYKKVNIYERHRHRYEVNNKYVKQLIKSGFVISGINKELNLVEMIEIAAGDYLKPYDTVIT